ncbi:LysR family transcriptional regulator [Devosia nitrariae]|uniref:LysR family transcriptional regulator n=1 Tax=Devosia nitrariae TaxID=2071872 RepID=A0ABQ5VYT6_9HYPH|nr:LysR family transcriptional regulator [Devosia nitrariae]GLQ52792.1 LysR family transcriptional regulator [Devosia nitrariae]
MLDLNDIAIFARVVEAGSFTGAARQLGLPKTSVSRRIAGLEREVGVRLLHRTTRSLRPTDAGRVYYEQSSVALRSIEEANQQLAAARAEPSGTIRISAPVGFAEFFLAEAVFAFLASYASTRVELLLTDDKLNLVEAGIDVAFRTGALTDSTLVARKLGPSHKVLCASPAYLAERGMPERPTDLSDHDCIIAGQQLAGAQWVLEGPNGTETVAVSGRISANTMEIAGRGALEGFGIAQLPASAAAPAIADGRLRRVLPDYATAVGGVYAVYPSSRHLSPTVRTFVDLAAERLSRAQVEANCAVDKLVPAAE